MNIVEVRCENDNSVLFLKNGNLKLKKDLYVIIETDKGLQFGKIVRFINDSSKFDNVELFSVIRKASKKDYFHYLDNLKLEKNCFLICKEIVNKLNLEMNILDAHYNFDRTQLVFRFIADSRIDFRQLARELGAAFHTVKTSLSIAFSQLNYKAFFRLLTVFLFYKGFGLKSPHFVNTITRK